MAGGPTETLPAFDTPPQLTDVQVPDMPALLPIESDFDAAADVTTFAEDHAETADQYIQQLGVLAAALVPPIISPNFPTNTNEPAISVPPAPAVEPIVWVPPPVPTPFTGQLTLDELFPEFTAAPPMLLFPSVPQPNYGIAPPAPGIDTNFVYPTVEVNLPPPPALLSINSYTFSGITLPELTATAPVLSLVSPGVVEYIPNAPYTDALLSELTTTLQTRLNIGNTGVNTGLPPIIEQNIWDRAREREYKQAGDAIVALDRMESMGYAFPPGVFIDAQIKIQTELAYVTMGLSRDVAIKQAELEQANIKMALESATAIESKLIDYANETEQRRFEACKYMTEAGVAVYNAQVEAFKAMVEVYRAAIDIYNAQIAGQRALIEAYQAEIAAEKLKVDMNTALVQQYQVQVNAALASIQVFQGEIDIIKTQAEIEQLKVSIFGEEVKAYATQINAYTAQVEAYRAQILGQQAIEEVFATQANVFKTQVDAVAVEINAQVEVFKAQLAAKEEEYEAYKALVEGQSAQVQAIAAANKAVADIYTAEVSGTSAYNDALVKEYQVALDEAIQITRIGVAAAEANANLYLTTKSIATDAAKVGAQVEAQIAASALGAVTYASHRARQDNVSYGSEQEVSQGRTQSVGYEQHEGRDFNINNEWQDSVSSQESDSTSTNFNHNISSVE